ncbi:C-type lectin domain family 1 member A-like [Emydura macquarii macquarii]|uniref:C-type lectin domain family 1 member A-like n=1 Tax=Emydura macquarii macquarii TaxID=1129001 RepID=UPI00352A705D
MGGMESDLMPARSQQPDPPPPQWLLTTDIFGILCLLLLIATEVLAFQVIQQGQKQELLTQQLKFYQSQTTDHPGTLQELPTERGDKCPARWMQSGNSWYLFAAADKTWGQCKSYCSTQTTWLLKTESKEETDFIQKESYLYFDLHQDFKYFFPFWIGLSYNSSTEKWVCVDSTALSSGLFEIPEASSQHYRQRACAYIQDGTVRVGACGDTRFCLCEKMMDLART